MNSSHKDFGYQRTTGMEIASDLRNRKSHNDGEPFVDETLLALRDGDHQAFHDIYCAYKESIQYFLRRLLNSEEEARELTQAIFVNVWERHAVLDPAKSIKSYLFAVARHTAVNHFKHLRVIDRHRNQELYSDGLDYDSDQEMIAHETRLIIQVAVDRMPAKRRKIFELSRYENLSNEQIAQKLNMNKATVASHLSQAMKEIREVLTLFYILFLMNR